MDAHLHRQMWSSTFLDTEGRPSFQVLQHRSTTDLALVYCAFDLLELDGEPGPRVPRAKRAGRER